MRPAEGWVAWVPGCHWRRVRAEAACGGVRMDEGKRTVMKSVEDFFKKLV